MATRTIQPSSSDGGDGPAVHVGGALEHRPVHGPGPGDDGQHGGADEQPVRDDAERVGRLVPRVAALVGQDEVADLAAGRAEREQQSEGVEARPDQTSTTQASPPTASTTPTAAARVTGRAARTAPSPAPARARGTR